MRETLHYGKPVISIREEAGVQDVADRMMREGVGCLVVEDAEGRPVGLLTDRDLALRVVASGRDAGSTTAAAVMSHPPIQVDASAPLERVIERMSSDGVRRVIVVRDGRAAGLVSLDDVVAELADELDDVAGPARSQAREARLRQRMEDLREEFESRLARAREQLERAGTQTREALTREFEALKERLKRPPQA